MTSHRAAAAVVPIALAALLLAGCGGGDDDAEATQAEDRTHEVADEPDADADAVTDDDTTADTTADTGTAASGPVDVCALFTADDFTAVFGVAPVTPAESAEAQGSLLGGCSYLGPDAQVVVIQARPAGEWEGTVEMYGGAPAAGASMDTSFEAAIGLLASFDGQDWFGHIMCSEDPGVWDEAKSVAIAEAIAAHL